MNRTVKSLLTILLVLLLIIGVSIIPLPSEREYDLASARNQSGTVIEVNQ